ncbi:MAG: tRNA (uridine(54)-C5)-methyltransferase TrmA [Myxococcales bacterium]|nr:tRNA (uridine(54)-C5)-methyltransferase TrmA [Myxococcales bacterium]
MTEYERALAAKVARVEGLFRDLEHPTIEVFGSPPEHYRMRAEFRFWHDGDDGYYAMYEKGEGRPELYRVDQLPAASRRINALMVALREAILREPALRRRLFQVEFLTTLSGEALITLIYHRPLDDAWEAAARALEVELDAAIIGRSRGQRIVLSRDYVTERLEIGGRALSWRQPEGAFSQPNGAINREMLAWADDVAAALGGRDLLELYCGNGNFTMALAGRFRRVLATEVSKASIAAARHNLEANAITNVDVARMASEEVAAALAGVREFRRLAGIDLGALELDAVLVDPPRAGLDPATLELVGRFPAIFYISCNPETLRANVGALAATHEIARFALFDQFPGVHHVECGLLLVRRGGA